MIRTGSPTVVAAVPSAHVGGLSTTRFTVASAEVSPVVVFVTV